MASPDLALSSDEDDDLLDFTPFSQKKKIIGGDADSSCEKQTDKAELSSPQESVSSSELMTPVALHKIFPPDFSQSDSRESASASRNFPKKDVKDMTNDEFDEYAQSKASGTLLPLGIDEVLPCHLKWHAKRKSGSTQPVRFSPCIVMKKADAIGLDIDTSFNEEMRDVVLFIAFHDKEEWKVVPKSLLLPYDSAYKKKKKIDSNSNDEVGVWNKEVCKRFQKQRQAKNPWRAMNKDPKLFSRAEIFYLNIILERAKENLERRKEKEHEKQRAIDEMVENRDRVSVNGEEEDELEEPYSQNFSEDDKKTDPHLSDCNDGPDINFNEKSRELIRPGDVITYWSHLYVAGDSRGLRETTIISVDPKGKPILTLSNGEYLPNDSQVRRIKKMVRKKIIDHSHGVFRQIDGFQLKKGGPLEKSLQPITESERIFQIVKKNRGELMKNLEADGAPADLLSNIFSKEKKEVAATCSRKKAKKRNSTDLNSTSPEGESFNGSRSSKRHRKSVSYS
eukprot:CAMPEP_0194279876 /NCGR_PEP_ID=MMETSP0169-20130528/14175_1 /TAXON_ID=218684 /ORGANISM="Corethron pennatum, Strain L29A3" /LENGTH=507 /DNA_ID=CAMNT_0039024353 /DNA_START=54 /DNA_END=1577 /DNA_ORIENTATION=-